MMMRPKKSVLVLQMILKADAFVGDSNVKQLLGQGKSDDCRNTQRISVSAQTPVYLSCNIYVHTGT